MKFIGHKGMQGLVESHEGSPYGVSPHGKEVNKRQTNCKICGKDLPRESGFKWLYFGINKGGSDYASYFFLCDMCNAYWMNYWGDEQNSDLIDQYKEAFNIKSDRLIPSAGVNYYG